MLQSNRALAQVRAFSKNNNDAYDKGYLVGYEVGKSDDVSAVLTSLQQSDLAEHKTIIWYV